ncbi:hypothetical protein [Cellulomonas uda]|nr:hypothetical protein [Cellulomonas uda]NII65570.1 hypothetical protein [Cellulomonas uda]
MASNVRSTIAKFGRISKELLRDPALSSHAKVVFAMLDEVSGYEPVSWTTLAGWMGVSRDTARRAAYELRDAGWLEIHENPGPRGQAENSFTVHGAPVRTPGAPVPTPPVHGCTPPQGAGAPQVRNETNETNETERERSLRRSRLPEQWEPTPEHRARAASTGLDVAVEATKFRLHAEAQARTAANWNSAFTTWLIRGAEFAADRPVRPSSFARKLSVERSATLDRVRAITGAQA